MKNLRKASMWNGWKKRELGKWLLLFAIESGISSSSSSCECWFQSMMCAILCLKFNQMYFLIHLPCALLHSIHTHNSNKRHHFLFDLVHLCNWYVSILSLTLSPSFPFFGFAHLVHVFISSSASLAYNEYMNRNTQKSHFYSVWVK